MCLGVVQRVPQRVVCVLAVPLKAQEPCHVVDAGDPGGHFLARSADIGGEVVGGALHAVAQANDFDIGIIVDRPAGHRHRVCVLEQPGVRAERLDVVRYVEQHRDGAQSLEDTTRADRVRDRLVDAVPERHALVDLQVVADPDGREDVIGPVQRLLAVLRRRDAHAGAGVPSQSFRKGRDDVQPFPVDVHQEDIGIGQRGGGHDVLQQPPGEDDAARADDRYFGQVVFSVYGVGASGPVSECVSLRDPAPNPASSAGQALLHPREEAVDRPLLI